MIKLLHGDSLDLLKTIETGSVDAVITDPPYMISTRSTGKGKLGLWADYCNASYWYAAWMQEAKRILKPTGCIWSFLNWRSFATFQKAACDSDLQIDSMLVWDKAWIGPGGHKSLRPCYELVALFGMEDFKIEDRTLRDIQTLKWSAVKPHGHPAEKPVALIEWLVEISTPRGGTVVDPFMGSGSTGVACVQEGRNFIGMELDSKFYDIASKRIQEAQEELLNDF